MHLEMNTRNLLADNFIRTRNLDGSTPLPAKRSYDTGQLILCFDSSQLTTTRMYNIRLQALTLARKCEMSHCCPVVWADGLMD